MKEVTHCPDCQHDEGRPREAPISVTRWTAGGTETTLRCPHCGWQVTRPDPTGVSATPPHGQPGRDEHRREA